MIYNGYRCMYIVGYMCSVVWDIMYIIVALLYDYCVDIWCYRVDVVCYIDMILYCV